MTPQADADSLPRPAASPDLFSRPRPRPPRSPSQAAKIRVQNRRRQYLEKNPDYLSSADNEFADPDLYDTLVRKFQTPAEREAEMRSRGWGKVLESSLMRGEDRLDRVASSLAGDRPQRQLASSSSSSSRGALPTTGDKAAAATNFAIDADLTDSKPATKEEGRAAWEEFLRERFVRGGDEEFDYAAVDGDESFDELEFRDREEEWFDGEEPEWASDGSDGSAGEDAVVGDGSGDGELGRRKGPRERVLVGQTGVQDY
ncbi:coiled-coil domain-containing protein [Diaporthe amygdali]|uniref:coiled-coil domain-containing protein n=1 Tax=Phomopsis amygdali TaxID=1214568 RepID=UPI0022FF3C55|nr:coiled-coil domain-containing protein [Diaporthe amygdali]KAJ0123691.1 coiled-coil domain-containing protein [Diaporthe amygdali]